MADLRFGDYEFVRRQRTFMAALGFLAIGLGVGALVALLITPKTGKQVRRDVRRKYEDARDVVEDLGDQAGDWMDKGSELADKARTKVAPLAKQFRR